MSYQRLTKLSDLGTLHALDFNGEEQPLCELTALDIDVLIRRLYELENKIESGELGDVKELKQELKAQELAANAYRIWFAEQKYWREVAERALDKATELAYTYRTQDDTLSCSSCPFDSIFDRCKERGLYEDCSKRWKEELLQQAEKRLAELKGEKE